MMMRQTRVVVLLIVGLLLVLSACETNDEADDRRFRECTAAGGSYASDYGKWSCEMPENP